MHLTDHDLRQLDDTTLVQLPEPQLRTLSCQLLDDLKVARERLNQNSQNSSRPSGSMEPWHSSASTGDSADSHANEPEVVDAATLTESDVAHPTSTEIDEEPKAPASPPANSAADTQPPKRKAGKQKGAAGYGRTQVLPTDEIIQHHAPHCHRCGATLANQPSVAYTAYYVIDLVTPESGFGLGLKQTKHICYDSTCPCGHVTRYQPHTQEKTEDWSVAASEWHLVGPNLASLIVFLSLRMRLSRARVKEFFGAWLLLDLSVGVIQQTIDEAARAVEPAEEVIIETLLESELMHADETSWRQGSQKLWLWVLLCHQATYYIIGRRNRKAVEKILFSGRFVGWLMSDGYGVYREFIDRLRCLAHLERKAQGLAESLDLEAIAFGQMALDLLQKVYQAVYAARQQNPIPRGQLYAQLGSELKAFDTMCILISNHCRHDKAKALAIEFLNDWEAIWAVLDFPDLPLTNNMAERALRHWIIMRRLMLGTRTEQGSHVFSLLASVIDTCRQRSASPWKFIAESIDAARRGVAAPALPAMILAA